jgi:hypothetical protein
MARRKFQRVLSEPLVLTYLMAASAALEPNTVSAAVRAAKNGQSFGESSLRRVIGSMLPR